MVTQNTLLTFNVEGVDWKTTVAVDATVFESERDQLIEATTRAIESHYHEKNELNLGPFLLVKPKHIKKEALVNAYICLSNAGLHEHAETLRSNYKADSGGQDLKLDEKGYAWE